MLSHVRNLFLELYTWDKTTITRFTSFTLLTSFPSLTTVLPVSLFHWGRPLHLDSIAVLVFVVILVDFDICRN